MNFFKSIDFIEDNLHRKISVHDIAKSSFQSTYHFSRIFKVLVGDSPKEYLRKRRLSVAANKLINTDSKILSVALDCLFESQEAFTRAFKKQFNVTPAQFRKDKLPKYTLYRDKFTPEALTYLQEKFTMCPEIVIHPETKVVGFLSHYEEDFDLLKVWKPFTDFAHENPIKNMSNYVGIGLYEANPTRNSPNQFSYICAVPVSHFEEVPLKAVTRIIPEQLYAKFSHKGELTNLNETLKYIWGSWLPKSAYLYEEKIDFELYPADFKSTNPDAITYIYIPIKNK